MRSYRFWLAAIAVLALSHAAMAQVLYQENFDVDPSASWQYNGSAAGSSADFFYDYSTVGIPPAPGGSSTRGLWVNANVGTGVFSGGSASPVGLSLPSEYVLTAYVWQNTVGPFPAGGSGSTQVSNISVGVTGTDNEFPGGTITGVQVGATGDGGSAVDYRVYSALMPNGAGGVLNTSNTPAVYPAGSQNNTATLYTTLFPGQTPPAAQASLYPATQTGTTAAGTPAFAWNLWEITKTASAITWKVNGTELATVDATLYPTSFGGNNIAFGQFDINSGSSTDPNAGVLIGGLYDNITVSAVPEPASFGLGSIAAVAGLLGAILRRRA
jgi:hypothetical protein